MFFSVKKHPEKRVSSVQNLKQHLLVVFMNLGPVNHYGRIYFQLDLNQCFAPHQ